MQVGTRDSLHLLVIKDYILRRVILVRLHVLVICQAISLLGAVPSSGLAWPHFDHKAFIV